MPKTKITRDSEYPEALQVVDYLTAMKGNAAVGVAWYVRKCGVFQGASSQHLREVKSSRWFVDSLEDACLYSIAGNSEERKAYSNLAPIIVKDIIVKRFRDGTSSMTLIVFHDLSSNNSIHTLENLSYNERLARALEEKEITKDKEHVHLFPSGNALKSDLFTVHGPSEEIGSMVSKVLEVVDSLELENACDSIRQDIEDFLSQSLNPRPGQS